MPILGFGLHFVVALFFAIHAIRNGRQMYWLMILFAFPILGSIVYFAAEYLPASKLDRGVRHLSASAVNLLDPSRELREAHQAFDLTPSAQNRLRLADALLETGDISAAVAQFELCLTGPFAADPHIQFGTARAKFLLKEYASARTLLEAIRTQSSTYHPDQVALLLAQVLAASGELDAARLTFEACLKTHPSINASVEFALFAISIGDISAAKQQQTALLAAWKHWPKHVRQRNKPLLKRLDDALTTQTKK